MDFPCLNCDKSGVLRFEAVVFHGCSHQGLLEALYGFVPFTRDGIHLLHKESHYTSGPSELSLLWKDLMCSRYLVETDMTGKPTKYQCISLTLSENGSLMTGDDPPICFTDLIPCSVHGITQETVAKPHRLLTFHLHEAGRDDSNGSEANLEFVGSVRNHRRKADLFSKILFQRLAREDKIQTSDLVDAVLRQERDVNRM